MAITSALVLYAVLWFMTFFVVLPIRLQTQGDVGEVVPGTHAGAPEHHYMKQKAWITTGIAAVLWCIIAAVITFEVVTVKDLDWTGRLGEIEAPE